jgi:cytochrome c biogenesis protein CcmG/thiol:disulfide interchange protein DsbE
VSGDGTFSAEKAAAAGGSKTAWRLVPVIAFFVLAGLFAYALRAGDPSKLPSALIGKPAPETTLLPLEGLTEQDRPVPGFSTAAGAGKVRVVNFWASWCVPCVQEHPLLVELKTRSGIEIHGINYKDTAAAARRFLGRYGNPYTSVGVDENGRAGIEWGVYGMPETFVLNAKGEIVYKHVGPITPDSLTRKVLPAIEAARR